MNKIALIFVCKGETMSSIFVTAEKQIFASTVLATAPKLANPLFYNKQHLHWPSCSPSTVVARLLGLDICLTLVNSLLPCIPSPFLQSMSSWKLHFLHVILWRQLILLFHNIHKLYIPYFISSFILKKETRLFQLFVSSVKEWQCLRISGWKEPYISLLR